MEGTTRIKSKTPTVYDASGREDKMESTTRIKSKTPTVYDASGRIGAAGVSGRIGAAFIACSISIISIGILTAIRQIFPFNEWLVPNIALAQYGGIFLYSHLLWISSWVILYFGLRNKRHFGNIRQWMIIFIGSVLATTLIAMYDLGWMEVFTLFMPR
jgi:hypothetical protein